MKPISLKKVYDLFEKKRYKEAWEILVKLSRGSLNKKEQRNVYLGLTFVTAQLGLKNLPSNEVEPILAKAESLAASHMNIYDNLAETFLKAGQPDKCFAYLEKAVNGGYFGSLESILAAGYKNLKKDKELLARVTALFATARPIEAGDMVEYSDLKKGLVAGVAPKLLVSELNALMSPKLKKYANKGQWLVILSSTDDAVAIEPEGLCRKLRPATWADLTNVKNNSSSSEKKLLFKMI